MNAAPRLRGAKTLGCRGTGTMEILTILTENLMANLRYSARNKNALAADGLLSHRTWLVEAEGGKQMLQPIKHYNHKLV